MNILELFEMNRERIVYSYQPDGEGESGKVAYLFADGKASVLSKAPDDTGGRYAFKACKRVEECVQKNNLPIKFIQAWH